MVEDRADGKRNGIAGLLLMLLGGLAFSTSAQAQNIRPVISGTPPTTAKTANRFDFRPTASDANGDTLTFRASGLPTWATIDETTGRVRGTPSEEHAGDVHSIRITVSDGRLSASLPRFKVRVVSRHAPTLSGTPPGSVKAGESYSFKPFARDPGGKKLTFSISRKPGWATFDPETGRLYGTPQSTRSLTHSRIVITASNGTHSTSMPAFSLRVMMNGAATISWSPPAYFEDGTPIDDALAGYRIHYGRSASDLSNVLTIPDAEITSAVIEDLAPGAWFFAVQSYTKAAVASDLSTLAFKSVD